MKNTFYLLITLFIFACGQSKTPNKKTDAPTSNDTLRLTSDLPPATRNVEEKKILWRAAKYDEISKDTVDMIVIDDKVVASLSEAQRAAVGYIATFIGNECSWDGPYRDDRSNLKCRILTALKLGYQCSAQHLDFLRKWFKQDQTVLSELENCPTIPDGATIQDTFEEIILKQDGNQIIISVKVTGYNMREGKSWHWSEIDYFQVQGNTIVCLKKEKSEVAFAN
ncbi:hypothetical protein [Sphingobacterium sp. SYP-B4668]|uniref:hypothetical protein n=1 Tax=Sphingobacterium sp. SYP-B4668 TaxID=2996035 RepID=UPI0022DD3C5A|nr:hypothetical protein [Sphingobacterium sp. SYP-B4668]